jgi:hypothetical protein
VTTETLFFESIHSCFLVHRTVEVQYINTVPFIKFTPVSFAMFVHSSACNSKRTAVWIFIKFDVGGSFTEICGHNSLLIKIGETLMDTLLENLLSIS